MADLPTPPEVSMSPEALKEKNKRVREKNFSYLILIIFIFSTLLQVSLTNKKEVYGFVQSLFFFALINLNVILIMFLVFLVSRNLLKAYAFWRAGSLGSSLRWKLVTSLLAFSLLPSILLFAGSSYVIRQGFDQWFSGQVFKALEDAQAITDVHYQGLENNLDFFSEKLEREILAGGTQTVTQENLVAWHKQIPVESLELYTSVLNAPQRVMKKDLPEWAVPRASTESLERAFKGENFKLIRQFGDGDLVQTFRLISVPVAPSVIRGARIPGEPIVSKKILVLSQTVPLGLKTRISDLRRAFIGYKQTSVLKADLKANYTLILLTLFMLILFVVSWFGLYIAKSVTDPVLELMKATQAVGQGEWSYRIQNTLPPESEKLATGFGADLEVLKLAFNTMAEEVGRRGRKLEEANVQLTTLVRELEDRERYLEILLSSIRRGVVVLDIKGAITRINTEAMEFSSKSMATAPELQGLIGQDWREVFTSLGAQEEARTWLDQALALSGEPLDQIFEIRTGEESDEPKIKSVRSTAFGLFDDLQDHLGWLIILEDVTDAARIERLAAWQEVAKRVAHEIKNPLTPIQISADRLYRRMGDRMKEDPEDGPVFVECVGQIQKQVKVIRDLVREFSQFAKLPEPQLKVVELFSLLEKVVADYKFTHPQTSFSLTGGVALEGAERVPLYVRVDAEYIRRLVVNLADNALQSMAEAKIKKPQFNVQLGLSKGSDQWVQIVFEDNGPGIPTELREKIFDPYVTSKASGLGLGLPIVRRIALEHSGRIRCEESEGGARFVVELPRVSEILAAGDELGTTPLT